MSGSLIVSNPHYALMRTRSNAHLGSAVGSAPATQEDYEDEQKTPSIPRVMFHCDITDEEANRFQVGPRHCAACDGLGRAQHFCESCKRQLEFLKKAGAPIASDIKAVIEGGGDRTAPGPAAPRMPRRMGRQGFHVAMHPGLPGAEDLL